MEQRIRPNRDTCGQAIGQVSKWKRRILAQVAILEKCTYPATVGHTLSDLCMAIRRRARSLCARIWHTHNDYSIFTYCTPRIRSLNPSSRRRRRHIICAIKLIAAALLLGQTPLWPLSSSSDCATPTVSQVHVPSPCPRPCPCLLCQRLLLRQSTSRFAQASPNKFHWASLHSGQTQLTKCAINRGLSEWKETD